MAAIDKIFDLLDTEPDMVDAPGARELADDRGDVALRGRVVLATTGRGRGRGDEPTWALRDVTLSAPAGETLALVGETGAGKSTLAKLVARFYDPQRGACSVDGHDLRDVTQASLRRQLGVVPQEGFLFGGHRAARTSSSGARARASSRSSRPRRRSARTSSSGGCPTATRPRSASAAAGCRPGSGS